MLGLGLELLGPALEALLEEPFEGPASSFCNTHNTLMLQGSAGQPAPELVSNHMSDMPVLNLGLQCISFLIQAEHTSVLFVALPCVLLTIAHCVLSGNKDDHVRV